MLEGWTSPANKTQFARVDLSVAEGRYVIRPTGAQGSHILGGLSRANALAVVPPEITEVE